MNQREHICLLLLAYTANEGFRKGMIDLTAPDCGLSEERQSVLFDAPFNGIPIRACFTDWRNDVAEISLAAWPSDEVDRWVKSGNAKHNAGEVAAFGWLDRSGGKLRIQNPFDPSVFISKHRRSELLKLPRLTDLEDPLHLYPRYLSLSSAT